MTNGEKIKEIFPNIIKYGNILIDDTGALQKNILFDDTWWNAEYKEPIIKNDLPHCQHTDEEIAKSFIEDVEAVKDQLPTTKNCESCRYYGSHHEVCNYCYKCSLWTEQDPTTKNNLGVDKTFYEQIMEYCKEHFLVLVEKDVWEDAKKALITKNDLAVDCINRADAIRVASGYCHPSNVAKELAKMPPVTPIRPKGHWIYKQRLLDSCSAECSACHNRSNGYVYDNGFSLECKYYDFCPKCGADMRDNTKRKGKPIEGNNESYNCENYIP